MSSGRGCPAGRQAGCAALWLLSKAGRFLLAADGSFEGGVPPSCGSRRRSLRARRITIRPMVGAEEFRSWALSLPEAEEQETWGHPTFRVRKKIFASMSPHEESASVKSTLPEQQALIEAQPEVFGIPDYVGKHGWVAVRFDGADEDEVKELVVEAWRMTAPKRVVAAFDAEQPAPGG